MCDENDTKPGLWQDEMTSVIRVKRKRDCDPAEALLLATKKCRNDSEPVLISGKLSADVINYEEKLFHFAATVEPGVAQSHEVVVDKVKEAIQVRSHLKERAKRKRKLPMPCSKLRQLKEASIGACQSIFPDKLLKLCFDKTLTPGETKPPKASQASNIDDCGKCLEYHKDDHVPKILKDEENLDEIMCNNTRMFREKLNLSESQKKDPEYVYDLYYCRNAGAEWDMSELLYAQPYRYTEDDIINCSDSDDEIYEDDDDSNDEGNWRNDYPDEDDSSESTSSSDDTWDRMAQEEDEDEDEDDDFGNQDNDEDDDLAQLGMAEFAAAAAEDDMADAFYDPGGNEDLGGGDNNI